MKKIYLILCIIILATIAVLAIVSFDKKNNNKNENSISMDIRNETKEIQDNLKEAALLEFIETLEKDGVIIKNKNKFHSEEINEDGYKLDVGNETIEIYNVSQYKLSNIISGNLKNNKVNVRLLSGNNVEAIYLNEILILNCSKNSEKIINIFKQ